MRTPNKQTNKDNMTIYLQEQELIDEICGQRVLRQQMKRACDKRDRVKTNKQTNKQHLHPTKPQLTNQLNQTKHQFKTATIPQTQHTTATQHQFNHTTTHHHHLCSYISLL
jgi:hypothetical protein